MPMKLASDHRAVGIADNDRAVEHEAPSLIGLDRNLDCPDLGCEFFHPIHANGLGQLGQADRGRKMIRVHVEASSREARAAATTVS